MEMKDWYHEILEIKCMLLEDRKSSILFKVTNAIVQLGGPPLIRESTLVSLDDMEVEVSKLKDKWVREFDNLLDFFEDIIRMWTMDYVNVNNNIYVSIREAHDDLIEIEK